MGKKFKNKDIASRLGVSGTLVSLVLNNKGDLHGIKKDTQEKVFALAKQMGYFSAYEEQREISPIEEKPGVIGMIVPSVSDPFVIGITPYLQKAFASLGMGFSIITKDSDDNRYDRMIGAFRKFFSGLIIVGDANDEVTIRQLRSTDYPFISVENSCKNLRINTVCSDDCAGAKMVADHIKSLGYSNIIILYDRLTERGELTELHDLDEELAKTGSFNKPVILGIDQQSGENNYDFRQFETLLRPPHKAEVVIAMNAGLVYPLISLARRKKIRIPQDLALISMEEGLGFDLINPPVTCIRKPISGMAIKVANMIWTEIKNNGKSKFKRQVNLAPELIVRDSCGAIL